MLGMTRRRRALLWVGPLIVLAGAGAIGIALLQPRSPINRENYTRIRTGMMRADVEVIFGGPAGDYAEGQLLRPKGGERKYWKAQIQAADESRKIKEGGGIYWRGGSGCAWVQFDDEDRVFRMSYYDLESAIMSPAERLRRWLGL
jgi:hypothetical protein